jgi:hypothetical protein
MKSLGIPRIVLLGLAGGFLAAQTPTPAPPVAESPQGLAEIARQLRAANANAPRAKKVFTNDNIANSKRPLSVVGLTGDPNAVAAAAFAGPGGEDAASGSDKAGDKSADKSGDKAADKSAKPAAGGKESKEDEGAWRARFAKAHQELDTEQRRLDVLQRELNLAQLQSYADPNQAMREQFQRTELGKRTGEIDQQKETVAAAKKALDDLLEEARKKGIPPAWAQ